MTVLLPTHTVTLGVRQHPWARDEEGVPVAPAAPDVTRGPYAASLVERANQSWVFRLDPAAWPVQPGDVLTSAGQTWVVAEEPEPRLFKVPGHPDVDYVGGSATLDPPEVR